MKKFLSLLWDCLFAPAGTFDSEASHYSSAADARTRNLPMVTTHRNHPNDFNQQMRLVEATHRQGHCDERSEQ